MQQMESGSRNTHIKAYTLLLISALIYGGNVIAGRLIAGQLPPLTLSAIRAVLALIIFLPLAWHEIKKAPKPNLRELCQLIIIGILGIVIPYNTLLLGLERTTGTNASIIFATLPAVTNTLLFLIYRSIPSKFKTLGMVTSFLGLIVVFTQGSFSDILSFNLGLGELILLINVLSIGLFNLLGQSIMIKFSSLVTSIYSLIFATLLLIPMGAWQLANQGWKSLSLSSWLIIFYMGFLAAGVAFVLNLYGINKIGSGQASIFNNLQHVFSISLSVIILKETLSSYHLIGFFLVISGVVLSLTKRKQKNILLKIQKSKKAV
jgi:drug/metabolite transporter (DMT)-like permease